MYQVQQNGTLPSATRFRVEAFKEYLRRRTCHAECKLGCYREDSDTDCVACKNVRLDGRCLPNCPADMLVVRICIYVYIYEYILETTSTVHL